MFFGYFHCYFYIDSKQYERFYTMEDEDDDKDAYYGCSCQRYLCVGPVSYTHLTLPTILRV